ncbi:MAG: hypothetical protein EOO03_12510 [Chitinophagaceae bacterium]|nr:MAG: hypothetical protein EOO03_12510 [Chitinophagaceae bacterium]
MFFPVLLCCCLLYFIVWLFIRPKQSLVFAIAVLLSIPAVLKSVALHTGTAFNNNPPANNIRVLTWNVGLLNLTARTTTIAEANNAAMLNKLKILNPDVVCLQEFFTAVVPGTQYDFIDSISRTLGYPYYYFSQDIPYFGEQYFSGNIIFSKHKIIDSNRTVFANPYLGALLKTSIVKGTDTVDIFTSRLRSVNFGHHEYETIDKMKKGSDANLKGTASILKKLRTGYQDRNSQVQMIAAELDKTDRPFVFAADFNDVPTGYAYAKLKNGRQDVWLQKGNGMGRTFKYISPTLRIDYIFASKQFEVNQVRRIISAGSDHYALMADVVLKKIKPGR